MATEDEIIPIIPIRLNLGCGHVLLDGFENMDAQLGWRAEDGLPHIIGGGVAAITISHMLMCLDMFSWRPFFAELYRVLAPGGVVRITEDETMGSLTSRRGRQPGARSETSALMVVAHLVSADFKAAQMLPDQTFWEDDSLIQRSHGEPPDVFHVEGWKV